MTRQDLPRTRSSNSAAPIIAFLAIFGLTLVVFFLQFEPSPAPATGGAPVGPRAVPEGAPPSQSMPLNAAFQQRLNELEAALAADPADTTALSELSVIFIN